MDDPDAVFIDSDDQDGAPSLAKRAKTGRKPDIVRSYFTGSAERKNYRPVTATCNHCQEILLNTRPEKLYEHIQQCKKVPGEIRKQCEQDVAAKYAATAVNPDGRVARQQTASAGAGAAGARAAGSGASSSARSTLARVLRLSARPPPAPSPTWSCCRPPGQQSTCQRRSCTPHTMQRSSRPHSHWGGWEMAATLILMPSSWCAGGWVVPARPQAGSWCASGWLVEGVCVEGASTGRPTPHCSA